jgi:hypothetical protein
MTDETADLNPWDQQPRETAKAYAAFTAYLRMDPGERSTARVGQEFGKSKRLIDRWSSTWSWVERVAAFDKSVADNWAAELMAQQGDAIKELLESARLMRTKAHDYLLKLTDEQVKDLKPDVVIRMLTAASRMISDAYTAASKPRPDDNEDDVAAILAEIRGIVHPGDE